MKKQLSTRQYSEEIFQSSQNLNLYEIQKNRKEENDIEQKELDNIHNQQPYSIEAFSEIFGIMNEQDYATPNHDMSAVIQNNRLSPQPINADKLIQVQENLFSQRNNSKEHNNLEKVKIGVQSANQDKKNIIGSSESHKLESSKEQQSENHNQNDTRIISNPEIQMKNSFNVNHILSNSNKVNKKKESIMDQNVKKQEKRSVSNWHKLKDTYKKNKPIHQITLEQYRLINDWSSSEYTILQGEIQKGNNIQWRIRGSDSDEINNTIDGESKQLSNDYVQSYIQTLTTVMHIIIRGPISHTHSSHPFQLFLELFIFFFGLLSVTYFIEKTISFIKENKKKELSQKNEINGIISYLSKQKVSQVLKLKIISYLKNYHQEEIKIIRSEGTQQALNKLSEELKKELSIHTNTEHLKQMEFFNNFSLELKIKLMDIMSEKIFQPGQIIFEDGETDNYQIYLINKGRVDLCYDTRRSGSKYSVIKELQQNDIFGSISFLTGFPRKCHAISKEISSLISIDRSQFIELLKQSSKIYLSLNLFIAIQLCLDMVVIQFKRQIVQFKKLIGEEKDQEIFCKMKDQFLYEEDQSVLNLRCFQCSSSNHISDQCILTHYYVHRKAILKVISSNFKQVGRMKFKRFRDYKNNSYFLRIELQKNIINFIEKYEDQINFLQEQIQMNRYCNLQQKQNSYNQKQPRSSEQIFPINNESDDQFDPYQSSQSSLSDFQESSYQEQNKSNLEWGEVVDDDEYYNDRNSKSYKLVESINQIEDNNKNNSNQNKGKLKKKKSSSMLNIQTQPQINQNQTQSLTLSMKNIIPARTKSVSSTSLNYQQHIQNNEPYPISDIQNEELDQYLSINNEQTIGSIFQNQDKKSYNIQQDQQFTRQRSSYRQTKEKSTHSLSTFTAVPYQRNSTYQKSSTHSQQLPQISISCNDFDNNNNYNNHSTPSINSAQQAQSLQINKKGSIKQQISGNINNNSSNNNNNSLSNQNNNSHGNNNSKKIRKSLKEKRRSISKKERNSSSPKSSLSSSSSSENNKSSRFDKELAPQCYFNQSQIMNSPNFDSGNIFIIENPVLSHNLSQEKQIKRSKFDLLQEKMNNDTESTPVSLLESICNMDSLPNSPKNHQKRKGILNQTSITENMRKIASLYSKGSTKTSIGQVLNLQMLNQYAHKSGYQNPNDIAPIMNFDKLKTYRYYYPQYNVDNIIPSLRNPLKLKTYQYVMHLDL